MTTNENNTTPLDIYCPTCDSNPGQECDWEAFNAQRGPNQPPVSGFHPRRAREWEKIVTAPAPVHRIPAPEPDARFLSTSRGAHKVNTPPAPSSPATGEYKRLDADSKVAFNSVINIAVLYQGEEEGNLAKAQLIAHTCVDLVSNIFGIATSLPPGGKRESLFQLTREAMSLLQRVDVTIAEIRGV